MCVEILEGHTGSVHHVAEMSKDHLVTAAFDKTVRIWNRTSEVETLSIKNQTYRARQLPNGEILVCDGSDLYIYKDWADSPKSRTALQSGHTNTINCFIQLQAHPELLISGSDDNTVRVTIIPGSEGGTSPVHAAAAICTHDGYVWDIIELQDGRLASCSSDGSVKIFTLQGELQHTLRVHSQTVKSLCQLDDGHIVTADYGGKACVWNLSDTVPMITMLHEEPDRPGACPEVKCVTQLSDGRLVTGSNFNMIRFWDATTGELLQTMRHPNSISNSADVYYLQELSDGCLASASGCHSVAIWS